MVSCCEDLHSLALVKVKVESLCVHSKPFQTWAHPLVCCTEERIHHRLLHFVRLLLKTAATLSFQFPYKFFQNRLNMELSEIREDIKWTLTSLPCCAVSGIGGCCTGLHWPSTGGCRLSHRHSFHFCKICFPPIRSFCKPISTSTLAHSKDTDKCIRVCSMSI